MKLLAIAASLLGALTSLVGCEHSFVGTADVSDAEYQVLSAYIAGKFKGDVKHVRKIAILNMTSAVGDPEDPAGIAMIGALPTETVHRQVFRAFLKVNRHASSFQRSFTLPVPYQILTESDLNSTFRTASDLCLLQLSRVGFSREGNEAAFHVTNHCPGSYGGGIYFVIMEKQVSSDWKIVQEVQLWVPNRESRSSLSPQLVNAVTVMWNLR